MYIYICVCVCAWAWVLSIPFFQAQDAVGSRRCHDTTDAELGQDFEMHPTVWNLELEHIGTVKCKRIQKCTEMSWNSEPGWRKSAGGTCRILPQTPTQYLQKVGKHEAGKGT